MLTNPDSGSAEADRVAQVCRALEEHASTGTDCRSPEDDEEYAEAVASAVGRDVVVVGGDGSVNRLLQEVHDQGLLGRIGAVGVAPMGTGNDLARGARLPLDCMEAAEVAVHGTPARRDLLLGDDGGIVVNAVHAGVAAEATAEAGDVKGVLGKAAYAYGAVRAGITSHGWHLHVTVDGEEVLDGKDRVLMVTLALGPSVGGGTPVAPRAESHDGRAEVMIARGVSTRARLGFALDLRKGRHTRRPDVTTTRGREIRVSALGSKDAFRVNTDGDPEERRITSRTWRLLDDGWELRAPG